MQEILKYLQGVAVGVGIKLVAAFAAAVGVLAPVAPVGTVGYIVQVAVIAALVRLAGYLVAKIPVEA